MPTRPESWMESSDVFSMFPTFVWNIQLTRKVCTALNSKILRTLDERHRDLPALATGEARCTSSMRRAARQRRCR